MAKNPRRRKSPQKKNRVWIWIVGALFLMGLYVFYGNTAKHSLEEVHRLPVFSKTEDVRGVKEADIKTSEEKQPLEEKKSQVMEKKKVPDEDKKQIDSKKAKDRVHKTSQGKHAKMAIILDDFGYSMNNIGVFNELPIPLTYAVLPFREYTQSAATSGHRAGKHIILHMPMESVSRQSQEARTLLVGTPRDTLQKEVMSMLNDIPYVEGANNHQGSKGSSDEELVSAVLSVMKRRGLYMIDSRTSAQSQIYSLAREQGVPTTRNELFLDNVNDTEAIEKKLYQAARIALESPGKYIVVIGHDRPHTAEALRNVYKELENMGILFVFASDVLV